MHIKKLIDSQFHKDIIENEEIIWKEPSELISSKRLDIAIKIDYIKSLFEKKEIEIYKDAYVKDIGILTNGTYIEAGDTNKVKIEDYKSCIDKLINEIKDNGFNENLSIIPISEDGVALDGAHRIAVCYVLNVKIPTIKINRKSQIYDVEYYRKRFVNNDEINHYILSYLNKCSQNISVLIEWPNKKSLKERILKEFGSNIIYSKQIKINYNLIKNLMLMNYWGEEWLGGDQSQNYGIHSKSKACFNGLQLKVYWIENLDISKVVEIKNEIRKQVGGGKHSLHSTETYEEVMNISKSLLNKKSLEMLYIIKPEKYSIFLSSLIEKKLTNNEDVAVCGSAILGLLGIRAPNDIDIISGRKFENLDSHNEYISLYNMKDCNDIYKKENYFYYFGIKFLAVENILFLKQKRNEIKDKIDKKEIENIYNNRSNVLTSELNLYIMKTLNFFVLLLIRIIKNLGLKDFVKSLLTKMNREN